MVITRQNNATAGENPIVTKFSKEQNDLKMKEVQEFAVNHAAGQYPLNLHVLGLNYSSAETEMIRAYCSMARIFHPDNSFGFDTSEMMKMIDTAKDGFFRRL